MIFKSHLAAILSNSNSIKFYNTYSCTVCIRTSHKIYIFDKNTHFSTAIEYHKASVAKIRLNSIFDFTKQQKAAETSVSLQKL